MHLNKILLIFLTSVLLASCHYIRPDLSDSWDLTEERRDSLDFALSHHYSEGFNFEVSTDSLILLRNRPSILATQWIEHDSLVVYHANRLVVADIMIIPNDSTDSVWVKVARDQETMGWTQENKLLKSVTPDDPISQFINSFSNSHLLIFIYVMGMAALYYLYRSLRHKRLRLIHFNDIDSFYPTLLCLLVSSTATLYALMQHYVPETWQEFYFHPTLNPFGLPFILSAFISAIWLLIILVLAVIDDVRKQLDWSDAFSYLLGLMCMCLVLYLFFTLTITRYIGIPCFIAYVSFALYHYFTHYAAHYICGECGATMHRKGRCPRCGAENH
ncbi:MAG: zinc ribbon domain-containing protein [Bacteroidaceae bacterium]